MKPSRNQQSKDEAAFQAVYDRYSREIWAIVYARWLHSDVALDIMQETFLRYWKQCRQEPEPIRNPRAWLLRVARNLAEDYCKSSFVRNGTQAPEQLNGVAGTAGQAGDHLERVEANARIRAVVATLPEADRRVLTLRYALEYDTPQIAEILDISVAAVHMRLSRARQRIAELLEPESVHQLP